WIFERKKAGFDSGLSLFHYGLYSVPVVTGVRQVIPDRDEARLAVERVAFDPVWSPSLLADGVVQELHIILRQVGACRPNETAGVPMPEAGVSNSIFRLVAADIHQNVALVSENSVEVVKLGERAIRTLLPRYALRVMDPAREVADAAVALPITGQSHGQIAVLAIAVHELILQDLLRDAVAHYAFFIGQRGHRPQAEQAEDRREQISF